MTALRCSPTTLPTTVGWIWRCSCEIFPYFLPNRYTVTLLNGVVVGVIQIVSYSKRN
ncbi:unnamed protein product [Nippostrongylus brasiliensis]|uniref:Inner membrane protein n=1 Tax=Nippostrongylus brasiliensis TaxID=27835 RepID=A0A0N4XR07_NIPBR|nr:unnamed protein product [Nippostrongylus brasiliensis]